MTSPATTRYVLDPAPAGLALAQDLLNTLAAGGQPDLLADLTAAGEWLDGLLPGETQLGAADLDRLRDFRADLERLTARGGAPDASAPSAAAERSAAAELVLGTNGIVQLRAGAAGAEYVISTVLAEILKAQQLDTWRRLKSCRNERCRVVFYDRSRNNSGVWHSLKTCGNPANLRAHRARNKELNG